MSEEQRLLADIEQEDRYCNKYCFYLLHLLWHGTMLYGTYINKDKDTHIILFCTIVFSLLWLIMLYSYLETCIYTRDNLYICTVIHVIISMVFLSLYITSIVLLYKSHLYDSTNILIIIILSLYAVFHVIINITILRKLLK